MSLSLAGDGEIVGFDAVASGFGGLVAVKSAIFTGTQTASVSAGSNVAVTDLSITHEVADASNKLIISGFVGTLATNYGFGNVGLAVHDGTSLIAIGDAASSATRVTAGSYTSPSSSAIVSVMPSVTFVHTPGTGSKTYTLRVINLRTDTRTLYVNRLESATLDAGIPRGASSLVIQEVKV